MPSVFSDSSGNDRDLTITTSGDWTIHTGDLPNGDNSASLSTALYDNARWPGEEFCITAGAGSQAFTVEAWVNVTAAVNGRDIAIVKTNSTDDSGANRHWRFIVSSTETIAFVWYNTTGTAYLTAVTSALTAGWHHLVAVVNAGSTRDVTVYVDGVSAATSSSQTGSPTVASSAVYMLFVGTSRSLNTEEMTDHMAKLAIYDRALSTGEISDHYLAMTAT